LRQLQGDFSKVLRGILERLTWILAHLEANIDFASEDIETASMKSLADRAQELLHGVRELLAGYKRGKIIRDGYQAALVGPPNVGKSSLLNALAGEDRAIVTPIAGTTRDFVEAEITVDGLNLTLVDTAGLRISRDPVESIGVERTLAKLKIVDLIFYVVDAQAGVTPQEREFFTKIPWEKTVLVVNKFDLQPHRAVDDEIQSCAAAVMNVSAATGEGLQGLLAWLRARIGEEVSEDSTLLSNARHFQGLETLRNCLEQSVPLMLNDESPDLIALELQSGLRALHEILGLTFDDQVMDKVFAEFCLGK
jgi:tRNA modification GTPase